MKKNLALILALVMLIGSLFCVIPMAEGEEDGGASDETAKYVPEIAYANVNYLDSITMMFAVPVPAELGEGEAVKLLFWTSRDESLAFNYKDMNKIVLSPEAELATIGGAQYYVFKYDKLNATQMLDVVCARPVVVSGEAAVAYGKLVDYSIREYVETAKGTMDGIAGLDNADALKTLDSMLNFGAAAQRSSGKRYDAYANDDLKKVYINAFVNGKEAGRVFAGFFKYEEGEEFTLAAPFFDGAQVDKVYDADGNELEDLDIYSEGIQLAMADADVEITAYYSSRAVKSLSGAALGKDFVVNNYDDGVAGGTPGFVTYNSVSAIMINGVGYLNFSKKSAPDNHYWASLKTIADPDDPTNDIMQFTGTHIPQFVVKLDTPLSYAGVGDTVDPVFTIEMELGSTGVPANTGVYIIRHRVKSPLTDTQATSGVNVFKIIDGKVMLCEKGAYSLNVGELPMDSLRKFAFVIDPIAEKIYAYAEDLETGEMVLSQSAAFVPDSYFMKRQAQHNANLADTDPTNDETLAAYENYYKFFLESTQEFTLHIGASKGSGNFSDLVENGQFTDMNAVKERAEHDYSFLMDNYNILVGRVYE